MENNPFTPEAIQNAKATLAQYGGNGQQAFYAECQRRGIDPNQALPQIQKLFNQLYGGNAK